MSIRLETSATSPRRYLPAWSLSLGFHAVVVILLALGIRGATPRHADPPPREVGIVLAKAPSERTDRYFREIDASQVSDPSESPSASTAVAASSDSLNTALPGGAAKSEMSLPEIQLPGTVPPAGSTDDLVVDRLTSGGRRSTAVLPGLGDEEILADEAARRAAERARGPATEVSIFGSAPAEGRSFVFAIDRSKSMGGDGLNALAAARTELSRALRHLAPNHTFQIVGYNHQCVYMTRPRLLPATDENKSAVAPFIDGLAAFGGTVHEMALRAALAMEPDAVFLLTDGGDPYLNEIQLANIRKLAAGRTTIHCIRFGFGPASGEDHFMKRLAAQNGGSYSYVNMSERSER
ncbi:MAG: VWA domain-containing protein [Planctomycetes bacterium]|nr:VWA domain-containing protein [Planctomycetota bacterium]